MFLGYQPTDIDILQWNYWNDNLDLSSEENHCTEDLILYKLMYLGLRGQPKHARDIVAILKTKKDQLNDEYIEGWVARLGLNSVCKAILDSIP